MAGKAEKSCIVYNGSLEDCYDMILANTIRKVGGKLSYVAGTKTTKTIKGYQVPSGIFFVVYDGHKVGKEYYRIDNFASSGNKFAFVGSRSEGFEFKNVAVYNGEEVIVDYPGNYWPVDVAFIGDKLAILMGGGTIQSRVRLFILMET